MLGVLPFDATRGQLNALDVQLSELIDDSIVRSPAEPSELLVALGDTIKSRGQPCMLKERGAPPGGRWSDLGVLEPVRDVKARHTSTLLVFEAVERALAEIEARAATASA